MHAVLLVLDRVYYMRYNTRSIHMCTFVQCTDCAESFNCTCGREVFAKGCRRQTYRLGANETSAAVYVQLLRFKNPIRWTFALPHVYSYVYMYKPWLCSKSLACALKEIEWEIFFLLFFALLCYYRSNFWNTLRASQTEVFRLANRFWKFLS